MSFLDFLEINTQLATKLSSDDSQVSEKISIKPAFDKGKLFEVSYERRYSVCYKSPMPIRSKEDQDKIFNSLTHVSSYLHKAIADKNNSSRNNFVKTNKRTTFPYIYHTQVDPDINRFTRNFTIPSAKPLSILSASAFSSMNDLMAIENVQNLGNNGIGPTFSCYKLPIAQWFYQKRKNAVLINTLTKSQSLNSHVKLNALQTHDETLIPCVNEEQETKTAKKLQNHFGNAADNITSHESDLIDTTDKNEADNLSSNKPKGENYWEPFSLVDSQKIEACYSKLKMSDNQNNEHIVHTDGGRYDVDLESMLRTPVYWAEPENVYRVKRCTWYYIDQYNGRYVPYNQEISERLENEYRKGIMSDDWNRKIVISSNEMYILYDAQHISHIVSNPRRDEWGGSLIFDARPSKLVVKRGVSEWDAIRKEPDLPIDHVIFVIHGIGEFCDFKFRTVNQCVDGWREMGSALQKTHFKQYMDKGQIGRVEFIPCNWHKILHGESTGIDSRLQSITLSSIKKLRDYANDTLVDILFYTSPIYCQTIIDTVCNELNRLYQLFIERNPNYQGTTSIIGHSLGSLIAFDLLSHQRAQKEQTQPEKTIESPEDETLNSSSKNKSMDIEPQFSIGEDETNPENNRDIPTEDLDQVAELTPKQTNLQQILADLHLSDDVIQRFKKEAIDYEALLLCNDNDLKDLGVPLGCRKKLIHYIAKQKDQHKSKLGIRQSSIDAKICDRVRAASVYDPTSVLLHFQQRHMQQNKNVLHSSSNTGLADQNDASLSGNILLKKDKSANDLLDTFSQHGNDQKNDDTLSITSSVGSSNDNQAVDNEFLSVGTAGTGQPYVTYNTLDFNPDCFFAMGSPIGLFLTIRGVEMIGPNYAFPTCCHFYNIFHPYDPVAFRLEPLIIPAAVKVKPIIVPHHKGRKRMHLELRENLNKMSYDIKHSLFQTFKHTMDSLHLISFPGSHLDDHQKPKLESSKSAFQLGRSIEPNEPQNLPNKTATPDRRPSFWDKLAFKTFNNVVSSPISSDNMNHKNAIIYSAKTNDVKSLDYASPLNNSTHKNFIHPKESVGEKSRPSLQIKDPNFVNEIKRSRLQRNQDAAKSNESNIINRSHSQDNEKQLTADSGTGWLKRQLSQRLGGKEKMSSEHSPTPKKSDHVIFKSAENLINSLKSAAKRQSIIPDFTSELVIDSTLLHSNKSSDMDQDKAYKFVSASASLSPSTESLQNIDPKPLSYKDMPEKRRISFVDDINGTHTEKDETNKTQNTWTDWTNLSTSSDDEITLLPMGQLNAGKRIDYALQEKPIESFNEYIFAMHSHVCYWESEDTILMVLNELYNLRGDNIHGSLHTTLLEEIKEAFIPSIFAPKK